MTGLVTQFRRWIAFTAALFVLLPPTVVRAQDAPVTITGRVTGEGGFALRSANVAMRVVPHAARPGGQDHRESPERAW